MENADQLSDEERLEQINESLAGIRELCGHIQAHTENIDWVDDPNDELQDLYEWCAETSAETYQFSDEDGSFELSGDDQ